MNFRKLTPIMLLVALVMAIFLFAGSSERANAQPGGPGNGNGKGQKIDHNERKAAAGRALQQGALNPLMVDAAAGSSSGSPTRRRASLLQPPELCQQPVADSRGDGHRYVGNPLIRTGLRLGLPCRRR